MRVIDVFQWTKLKNLILLEVCSKLLKKTKGTVTGDLMRLSITKVHKVKSSLGTPHIDYG